MLVLTCAYLWPQIDLESVFALNPDVAPDEEIPQSPEAPPSNIGKTSKLPKVCSSTLPVTYTSMIHSGVVQKS